MTLRLKQESQIYEIPNEPFFQEAIEPFRQFDGQNNRPRDGIIESGEVPTELRHQFDTLASILDMRSKLPVYTLHSPMREPSEEPGSLMALLESEPDLGRIPIQAESTQESTDDSNTYEDALGLGDWYIRYSSQVPAKYAQAYSVSIQDIARLDRERVALAKPLSLIERGILSDQIVGASPNGNISVSRYIIAQNDGSALYWHTLEASPFYSFGSKSVEECLAFVEKQRPTIQKAAAILAKHHPEFEVRLFEALLAKSFYQEINNVDGQDPVQDIAACYASDCSILPQLTHAFDVTKIPGITPGWASYLTWKAGSYSISEKSQGYGPGQIILGLYQEALAHPIAEDYKGFLDLGGAGDDNVALKDILEPETCVYAMALKLDYALTQLKYAFEPGMTHEYTSNWEYPFNTLSPDALEKLMCLEMAMVLSTYPEKARQPYFPSESAMYDELAEYMVSAKILGYEFPVPGLEITAEQGPDFPIDPKIQILWDSQDLRNGSVKTLLWSLQARQNL